MEKTLVFMVLLGIGGIILMFPLAVMLASFYAFVESVIRDRKKNKFVWTRVGQSNIVCLPDGYEVRMV